MILSKELDKTTEYICEICNKNIDEYQKCMECCLCHYKIHSKCTEQNQSNVYKLDVANKYPICSNCKTNTLPLQMKFDEEPSQAKKN